MSAVRKVMILAARAGAGHLRAALALEQALRETHPQVEVLNLDALDFTPPAFRRSFGPGYERLVKDLPSVWRMIYEGTDQKPRSSRIRKLAALLDEWNTRALRKEVDRFDPDRIVCTHFMPSGVLAARRRKGKLRAPVFVALTDYDIHAMWLAEGVDHYFVATRAMAYALQAAGVAPQAVSVTGIPIPPVFSHTCPGRGQMRRTLGLRPEAPTALLSTGSFAAMRLDRLAAGLAELQGDVQLLAVAGRDAKLHQSLQRVAADRPGRVAAFGFVDNMHELMAASDLAVAKPGGLTSSECMAMGLPMVLVNPIPGQEERNSDYLLEAGCAVRAHSAAELHFKVAELLANPTRLEAMSAAALRAARPRAAYDVAARVTAA